MHRVCKCAIEQTQVYRTLRGGRKRLSPLPKNPRTIGTRCQSLRHSLVHAHVGRVAFVGRKLPKLRPPTLRHDRAWGLLIHHVWHVRHHCVFDSGSATRGHQVFGPSIPCPTTLRLVVVGWG